MSNRRRVRIRLFAISLLVVMYLPFPFMHASKQASKQTKHVSFPFICAKHTTHTHTDMSTHNM
jgi:hypothetical protein